MYIPIYQNINMTKKICIKIVPTDCFACEARQGTQKSNIIYVERNKLSKN